MKNKSFSPFLNYLEDSINEDFSIMRSPIFLNNVDDFNFYQKDIITQKNNIQFNDYDDEDEEENDFPCVTAKNCVSNYDESNFINIFSFENEQKEIISHVYTENNNIKEDGKKIKEMSNLSRESSNRENDDELNSLNSKDYSKKNKNNIFIPRKPIIETSISNQMCENIIDSNIINQKPKKTKINWQNLEIDYEKEFQLFNKGTNNLYVNEIINSINNTENQKIRQLNKLFKTYNIENGENVKLIGRKRKNEPKKKYEKPDDIRKKLKSRFHKIFTQKINDNLKAVNSEKKFYLMPQIFIGNTAKKQNKEVMNMKIKDLFRKNFIEDYKEYKTKNLEANNDKYLKNLNTLEYLEKNIDIQEKCKFNIIGEMKYFEMLEEFFYSEEFEETVIAESKNKSFEYVKDYVFKARTYVKFFLSSD